MGEGELERWLIFFAFVVPLGAICLFAARRWWKRAVAAGEARQERAIADAKARDELRARQREAFRPPPRYTRVETRSSRAPQRPRAPRPTSHSNWPSGITYEEAAERLTEVVERMNGRDLSRIPEVREQAEEVKAEAECLLDQITEAQRG